MGVQKQIMMRCVLCVRHCKGPVTQAKGFTGCRVFQSLGLERPAVYRLCGCLVRPRSIGLQTARQGMPLRTVKMA